MNETAGNKKKFSLFSAILSVICVVFVAEAAAPVAAIGNSQYFWWILLMITFLLPYGLISSELGTTYVGDGGIYDWVTKAFGRKWGSRTSWYYWINFPLWMASLAVMCPDLISIIFGIELNSVVSTVIALIFIWVVVLISFFPVSDSIWILNGAAVIKVLVALIVGGLGIYVAVTKGVVTEFTPQSLLPTFNPYSLSFISVILFNFLGFEVICTFSDDMQNPKKQIPQAIIAGGVTIAAIYIFSAFGIGAAIPADKISPDTGLVDSVQLMLGGKAGILVAIVAFMFLLTLFGNMISWSLGVNNTAAYAADNGDLPKVFGIRDKKRNMPTGTAILNGIVASIVVILAPVIPNKNLFWSFFALNLVMFLLAYLPVFPAFLKLRKIDPDTERPFKVGGGKVFHRILAALPMIMIIISLIFIVVPMNTEATKLSEILPDAQTFIEVIPITIGSVLFIAIGEIIIKVKKIK